MTNTYGTSVTDDLPVYKRIVGDTPSEKAVFTFVLTAGDASYPMPAGSNGLKKEINITGIGSGAFGKIEFTEPGIYAYTISERDTGTPGYSYDTKIYTVTYEVELVDGELEVTRTVRDNSGNKVYAIEFTNSYKTPGEKLPQTGALWWPVPVLLLLGCLFVLIGVIRRRRSEA